MLNKCLVDVKHWTRIPSLTSPPTRSNLFHELLHQFPDLTRPSFSTHVPDHGVHHHIITTGPPVWSRPWRLAPDKLRNAKREFDNLMKLGIA